MIFGLPFSARLLDRLVDALLSGYNTQDTLENSK